jgi:hypothetical protein
MTRLKFVMAASMLLAGCPIAADNYGVDAGDAGSVADAGSTTPTPDAGSPTGTIACTISAQNDFGSPADATSAWSGTDLIDSTATSSDGTTYDVTLEGSNSVSGTIELAFEEVVDFTGPLPAAQVVLETFASGSNLAFTDSWSCGAAGGDCGANVTITSFDGQTVTGTFTVQFVGSDGSECSLNPCSFNVTIPQ